jgi:hypothetical protein
MISMIPNRDDEGNQIFRNQLAAQGMLFRSKCIDFKVATINSICNRRSDHSDIGDAELRFFDSNYAELTKSEGETDEAFQVRLTASCKFTWMVFTPTTRYAIRSGHIAYKGTPTDELDAWFEIAPHIPREYGGSVPFMDGGLALDLFNEGDLIHIDGGACAIIEHDPNNYSHRIGVKIEHEVGDNIRILAIFDIYV